MIWTENIGQHNNFLTYIATTGLTRIKYTNKNQYNKKSVGSLNSRRSLNDVQRAKLSFGIGSVSYSATTFSCGKFEIKHF